jgi:peptidoglycan/LPS O-acetylase OafA/YrhL
MRTSQPHHTHAHAARYLHSLDFARGVAALAVVLWHWQHFFFNGPVPGAFQREEQPFYSVLFLFYEKGWFAVDFFFALSGFVFFWLYANPIRQRRVSTGRFFFLRLSRLYPLHLATLLLVAGLQWLYLRHHSAYFVYPLNDTYHFILNLFFAPAWGLEKGFSFNAPIWSVSVEVLLYGMFFCVARLLPARAIYALLLAIAGLYLQSYSALIGRGLFAFYMGALVYFAYQKLVTGGLIYRSAKPLLLICLSAWLVTLLEFQLGSLQVALGKFCSVSCVGTELERMKALWVTGLLLPITILTLAVRETALKGGWQRTAWLGDISYASYLLHFPLQLVFFSLFAELLPDRAIFYSPVLLLGYFVVLISSSLLTHRYFERPLQQWIRRYSLQRHSI